MNQIPALFFQVFAWNNLGALQSEIQYLATNNTLLFPKMRLRRKLFRISSEFPHAFFSPPLIPYCKPLWILFGLTNWIWAMTWGGRAQVICPFSVMFCYFLHSVAIFWKALTEVSSLGTTGFRFSHTGSHPWARGGMKSCLCHVTGKGCQGQHTSARYTTGKSPTTFWYRAECPNVCSMCLNSA